MRLLNFFSPEERDPVAGWKNAPRQPVLFADDPDEWRILEAMWLQQPVRFQYWGGASPGALRRIIPRRVFRVGDSRSLYFSGWCELRQAERVFRLDRVRVQPMPNASAI